MRGNAPREIVDILQEIRTKLDLRQVWHTDVVQRIFGSELTQMVIYKQKIFAPDVYLLFLFVYFQCFK